jgi:hypothetical protein
LRHTGNADLRRTWQDKASGLLQGLGLSAP